MTVLKAALFDMDGVVIDTRADVERIWGGLARALGRDLSGQDILEHVHGVRMDRTLDRLFPGLSDVERASFQHDVLSYETATTYTPVPGVIEVLKALRIAGVPTALVTSSYRAKVDRVLPLLGLESAFRHIVCAEDVTRGKPDPEPYAKAAALLDVPAASCVVFEDSLSGLRSGSSAGAVCVGIGTEDAALRAAGAALVVPDFTAFRIDHGDVLRLRADPSDLRFRIA